MNPITDSTAPYLGYERPRQNSARKNAVSSKVAKLGAKAINAVEKRPVGRPAGSSAKKRCFTRPKKGASTETIWYKPKFPSIATFANSQAKEPTLREMLLWMPIEADPIFNLSLSAVPEEILALNPNPLV